MSTEDLDCNDKKSTGLLTNLFASFCEQEKVFVSSAKECLSLLLPVTLDFVSLISTFRNGTCFLSQNRHLTSKVIPLSLLGVVTSQWKQAHSIYNKIVKYNTQFMYLHVNIAEWRVQVDYFWLVDIALLISGHRDLSTGLGVVGVSVCSILSSW